MNHVQKDLLFHLKCGRKNKKFRHASQNIRIETWSDGYKESIRYSFIPVFDIDDSIEFNRFLRMEIDKFFEEEFSMNHLLGLPLPNKDIIKVFFTE